MHKIEQRFLQIQDQEPLTSSIICFIKATNKVTVRKDIFDKLFNKLVDEDDYEPKCKKYIINWIYYGSESSSDCKK